VFFAKRPPAMPLEMIRLVVFLPKVNHLGAGNRPCWWPLEIAIEIKFAARIVAAQDAARILPGDRRAGLDLGPGNLRIVAAAIAALGDEIVDAALAFGIAGGTSSAPSNI